MHPSTFPPRIPAVSRFSGTHFDRLSVAHFAAHSCHASQHIPATHPSSFPFFWHAFCSTFPQRISAHSCHVSEQLPDFFQARLPAQTTTFSITFLSSC